MTDQSINCPDCGGPVQKYGKTPSGVQRYRCVADGCLRQFIPGSDHLIEPEVKALVLRMIDADVHPKKIYQSVNGDGPEKISLRWIQILRRKVLNDRRHQ
jgi:transposase-like protein